MALDDSSLSIVFAIILPWFKRIFFQISFPVFFGVIVEDPFPLSG